jgi:putative phage-type endonuclease
VATRGQSENILWHAMRKFRITASHFAAVLQARKRKSFTSSLYATLQNENDLQGIHSVAWGRENEKYAVKMFQEKYGIQVKPCGIFLSDDGLLGASPDGVIDEAAIIEVKCPYKWRNVKLVTAASDQSFFLSFKNGSFSLKNDCAYYHQIQGQLHLSEREVCYFIVYSPVDFTCLPIRKDNSWLSNLFTLKNFAKDNFLPYILSLQ